jgi:hypothetical protein
MARIDNLTNFLNDVATAIRTKTGKSAVIPASQFDIEILSIPAQGVYESKILTILTNGVQTITPASGYDAIESLTLTVQVPITDTSEYDTDLLLSQQVLGV